MGSMVYNVNDTATQVLASKQIKENVWVNKLHYNGQGVNEIEETNVSTIRFLKNMPDDTNSRQLNEATNGGFFNTDTANIPVIEEYDMNLLYIYDRVTDIPEVQQDMCPVDIFDSTMSNIAGKIATDINASTIANQLASIYNKANSGTGTGVWTDLAVVEPASLTGTKAYEALMTASTMLDDGDMDNGIQSFPFNEREILIRPQFRAKLMSEKGIIVGGSNYGQSMLAKGTISPDTQKDFAKMYVGEIDAIPVYLCPSQIWKKAGEWVGTIGKFDNVDAIVMSAKATDRGISFPDYVKIIDSPNGAGKRLQPKTRWGVNVCYPKGIVPILKNGTAVESSALDVIAPASRA